MMDDNKDIIQMHVWIPSRCRIRVGPAGRHGNNTYHTQVTLFSFLIFFWPAHEFSISSSHHLQLSTFLFFFFYCMQDGDDDIRLILQLQQYGMQYDIYYYFIPISYGMFLSLPIHPFIHPSIPSHLFPTWRT